eukprot:7378310-Prymnesium_polylepis.1
MHSTSHKILRAATESTQPQTLRTAVIHQHDSISKRQNYIFNSGKKKRPLHQRRRATGTRGRRPKRAARREIERSENTLPRPAAEDELKGPVAV